MAAVALAVALLTTSTGCQSGKKCCGASMTADGGSCMCKDGKCPCGKECKDGKCPCGKDCKACKDCKCAGSKDGKCACGKECKGNCACKKSTDGAAPAPEKK